MTEFHKIWIEQCDAAEGIRERFGTKDAARYLIGEKLMHFMEASHERPEFAEELPKFANRIKEIFQPHEIEEFFDDLRNGQVPDPVKILDGRDANDPADVELDEFQVLNDADKILLAENAKRLLLPSGCE